MRSALSEAPASASLRRRARWRLLPSLLVALGALGYAHHLARNDDPGTASASVAAQSFAGQSVGEQSVVGQSVAPVARLTAVPKRVGYDPRVTAADSGHALEATLPAPAAGQRDTPAPPVRVDPEVGGRVPTRHLDRVVPGRLRLGPVHVDPMPPGVTLASPTDTESLYARSGAVPLSADRLGAASAVPPGTPNTRGLTAHVRPSCTGTGTDGKRVQAMYVHESSTPSRYGRVLSVLRNEVANVDDVFAVSARKTGGDLRVRWVHDADCVPVILDVTVPDGSLGPDFAATIKALKTLGYDDPDRKYVAFADADQLCGIGTLYENDAPTANPNDGYAASYSRIDTNCWSTGESVAAHELTHNLGGVQRSAPHSTAYGHCYDESDLMCYDDGSGVAMRSVCPSAQSQLLDCNDDDYFNTHPAAGSYLAKHWDTARSGFLDDVSAAAPTAELTVPDQAVAGVAFPVSVTPTGEAPFEYRWAADGPCALSSATAASASVTCSAAGDATLTVAVTQSDGQVVRAGPAPVRVSAASAGAPPVASSWTRPRRERGLPVRLSAGVRDAVSGAPLAGVPVRLEVRWRGADAFVPAVDGLVTDAAGRVTAAPAVDRAGRFRFSYGGGSTYTASASPAKYVKVPTRLKLTSRPRHHLLVGRLTMLDGTAVPHARVTLMRRPAGSRRWVAVASRRTDRHGRLRVRVHPHRRTVFRWRYHGEVEHQDSRSARLVLRR